MTRLAVMVLAVVSTLMPATTLAEPSPPAVEPLRQPPATPSAESEYNRGVRARLAKDWSAAEKAFRAAIALRAAYPEAWNDLGYALRNQGRYTESLQAYDQALRLRPNFPEALEYLGEAYVQMGQIEEAKAVLDRLRPLDPKEAEELAKAIAADLMKRTFATLVAVVGD